MNPQEQQMIESLFQRLAQGAVQAGPRDPEAEALIQQRVQGLPGAAYYMAQTLLVQERALQQAEARLSAMPQGGGSFLPPGAGYAPPGYAAAPQPVYQQPGGSGVGGFLAGAGKIALGVGGGILVADAAMGLAHDLFGEHQAGGFGPGHGQAYDEGYQQGQDQADAGGIDPQGEPGGYGDSQPYQDDGGFDQQQDEPDQSGDW